LVVQLRKVSLSAVQFAVFELPEVSTTTFEPMGKIPSLTSILNE